MVLGGESFVALSGGCQNALWLLGAVPQEHRTDSLSAAYRNLDQASADDLTRRYQEFCDHYRHAPQRATIAARPMRTAASKAPTATSSAPLSKPCCCAAPVTSTTSLPIAPSSPRSSGRHNARHRARIDAERAVLAPLPAQRTSDFELERVQVTPHSGFNLRKVFYSVPSRLIGYTLRVHLYDDRLELFVGSSPLMTLPRGRAHSDGRRGHVVDYHHLIHALRRKPMALLHLVYRDQLFPRDAYRRTFDALLDALDEREACRRMGRAVGPGPRSLLRGSAGRTACRPPRSRHVA